MSQLAMPHLRRRSCCRHSSRVWQIQPLCCYDSNILWTCSMFDRTWSLLHRLYHYALQQHTARCLWWLTSSAKPAKQQVILYQHNMSAAHWSYLYKQVGKGSAPDMLADEWQPKPGHSQTSMWAAVTQVLKGKSKGQTRLADKIGLSCPHQLYTCAVFDANYRIRLHRHETYPISCAYPKALEKLEMHTAPEMNTVFAQKPAIHTHPALKLDHGLLQLRHTACCWACQGISQMSEITGTSNLCACPSHLIIDSSAALKVIDYSAALNLENMLSRSL